MLSARHVVWLNALSQFLQAHEFLFFWVFELELTHVLTYVQVQRIFHKGINYFYLVQQRIQNEWHIVEQLALWYLLSFSSAGHWASSHLNLRWILRRKAVDFNLFRNKVLIMLLHNLFWVKVNYPARNYFFLCLTNLKFMIQQIPAYKYNYMSVKLRDFNRTPTAVPRIAP